MNSRRKRLAFRTRRLCTIMAASGLLVSLLSSHPARAASPTDDDNARLNELERRERTAEPEEKRSALFFDAKTGAVRIVPRDDVVRGASRVKDLIIRDQFVGLGDASKTPELRPPRHPLGLGSDGTLVPSDSPVTSETKSMAPASGLIRGGIFGSDDRYRIFDTQSYSSNSFVQLKLYRIVSGNRVFKGSCSGVYYGARWVVTAGHCIYDDDGGINNSIDVYRGRDGSTIPYGVCHMDSYALDAYQTNGPAGNDYAMLRTADCTVPGTYGNGIEPMVSWAGNIILSGPNWVTGYPGTVPQNGPADTMWEGSGQLVSNTTNTWRYTIDMTSGQSGGPTTATCGFFGYSECVVGVNSREQNRLLLSQNVSKRWTSANIATLAFFRDTYP